METRTYAEILARQGELLQAQAIYRALLAKQPGDETLRRRLGEIEAQQARLDAPPPPPKSRAIERLEALLHRIQSRLSRP